MTHASDRIARIFSSPTTLYILAGINFCMATFSGWLLIASVVDGRIPMFGAQALISSAYIVANLLTGVAILARAKREEGRAVSHLRPMVSRLDVPKKLRELSEVAGRKVERR